MSTVHFSFDLETWIEGEWIGDPVATDPPATCDPRELPVRRIVRGSIEYLEAPVWITVTEDETTTTVQTARVLLDTNEVDLPGQGYPVYVRVTDTSETPIILAGSLELV